jgi:hypothetical protein
MKLTWALGGTFAGLTGAQMRAIAEGNGASGIWLTLESWGLDGTALLAMLGVFLLWRLVRPWGQVFPRWLPLLHGQRVPRWLPLSPAVIGAATLAPYGVVGLGYCALAAFGVLTMPRGTLRIPATRCRSRGSAWWRSRGSESPSRSRPGPTGYAPEHEADSTSARRYADRHAA